MIARARRHKKRKKPTKVEITLPVTASSAQIALFMPAVIGEAGSPPQTEQAWAEDDDRISHDATVAPKVNKDCFEIRAKNRAALSQ